MFSPRGIASILVKAPSDVVILSSLRTPICRANRGSLKDAFPEELLASVLKATIDGVPNLDPSIIEDVAVGVVLYELGGSKAARMAMNHVGYPNTTHLKAAEARAFGLFSDEIVPVTQKKPDGLGEVVVDTDDGIRPQASSEGLAKLKPAFRENGTSTAGNSSQVSDGARFL
uniref:Thiolase N-terminal domain-containing protein n=1 Tax=Fusarium oxysporum (strain Fo5176) TaxID=660025 RepID=A0A0D2YB38_FUSOF